VKATLGKRVLMLEQIVKQKTMRRFRSLDFSAITDKELDYLAWIAEQRVEHGDEWIEATLTSQELVELDAMLARVVVLQE
jgi:hypothetical protein